MKICNKCKIKKAVSEFGKDKARSDGLHCYCRQCKNQASAFFYNENSEKIKAKQAKHRLKTPNYGARYYAANLDKMKEVHAKYRSENCKKIKECRRKYYLENAEKVKTGVARYRAEQSQNGLI